uniref:Olfactory receptor, family 90, subfamily H, member 3 n=2 Tax=Lepisosteus oculatus TaxID=7918 RepID=W5NPB0_LEPOC
MNSTTAAFLNQDVFYFAFLKNFTVVLLGVVINYMNTMLVFTFFKNQVFSDNPRYILYIHMVINDILLLTLTVSLHVLSYIFQALNVSLCCFILLIAANATMNTPLNLAGMAIERYIAICHPLRHSQICTVRRTYILIAFIWCAGAIPRLTDLFILFATKPLSLFSSNILCYSYDVFQLPYKEEKNYATHAVYLFSVWLILIITYFRILFAAKAAASDAASAKKARNTILLHGAQLLLCMLSYITPVIDTIMLSDFPQYRTHILFLTYLVSHIVPRILSPLIYGIRDEQLKKHMKRYILCKQIVQIRPTKE